MTELKTPLSSGRGTSESLDSIQVALLPAQDCTGLHVASAPGTHSFRQQAPLLCSFVYFCLKKLPQNNLGSRLQYAGQQLAWSLEGRCLGRLAQGQVFPTVMMQMRPVLKVAGQAGVC